MICLTFCYSFWGSLTGNETDTDNFFILIYEILFYCLKKIIYEIIFQFAYMLPLRV